MDILIEIIEKETKMNLKFFKIIIKEITDFENLAFEYQIDIKNKTVTIY